MARLSLTLLGAFQARLDGQFAPGLHSNTVRALLAFLAVERDREHTRRDLAELLWPEQSDATALSNLRYTLSDLRHALGDTPAPAASPILIVTRDCIRFRDAVDCRLDVREFDRLCEAASTSADHHTECERLEEAATLYRGAFLQGFALPESAAFEDWLFWTRDQFQRKMMGVLRRLVTLHLDAGRYAVAQTAAQQQVQLEPLDEGAHRQLMYALALGGDRSAALVQYERCRQMLVRELHVEPTRETVAVVEAIRAGAFEPPIHLSEMAEVRLPLHASKRSPANAGRSPAAFVARERELEQLDLYLAGALAGHGRVVFVAGDAGSGKTALMQEYVRRALDSHSGLVAALGSCSAIAGIGDPYQPFRDILQMLSGDVEARRAGNAVTPEHARRLWALLPYSVQALVEQGPDLVDLFVPAAPLLQAEALTHWPGDGTSGRVYRRRLAELAHGHPPPGGPSGVEQVDIFEQVTRVIRCLAVQKPLLLVVDDLQWADRGTIGLLFHLGRRLGQSRILLLGAYRPDEVALGRDGARHPLEALLNEIKRESGDTAIDLNAASGRGFVDALLGSEPNRLPETFAAALYQRTEGHALFTVEMLRGLQERGDLVRDEEGYWCLGPALDWERLPGRVEAVIAERVGRLPHEWQALLSAASVEGDEFTAEVVARLLAAPGEMPEDAYTREEEVSLLLSGPLRDQQMVVAQSLRRLRGGRRLSRYRFRHFLFYKFLYDTLDPIERAKAHEAVAKALEEIHREDRAEVAVHLAWHFEQAGLVDQAVDYLLQAGRRAMELSAHHEAVQHLRRGLKLLSGLRDSPERMGHERDLQLALGSALLATEGMGSQAQILAYRRAYDLSARLGVQVALWPALHALASASTARGQYQQALALGEQLLTLAQCSTDPAVLALAHFTLGQVLFSSEANLLRAREHLEQSIRYYDDECDSQSRRFLTTLNLFDLGVNARAWLASVLWILGLPDQALERSQQALETAQQLGHLMSQVLALYAVGHIHIYRREDQALWGAVQALERLLNGKHVPVGEVWVAVFSGWLRVRAGQVEDGLARLRQGTEAWQKSGAVFGVTPQLRLLADACLRAGALEEGLEVVDRALALVESAGARTNEAELHRLRGELLLARGDEADAAEAEACFWRSLQIARAEVQKGWELRAVTSLARLHHRTHGARSEDAVAVAAKAEEAQRMLTAVYAWFSEGFDTPDLHEAAVLLDIPVS